MMAILEIIATSSRNLKNTIEYILNDEKTSNSLTCGIGLNPNYAYEEMTYTKIVYNQNWGLEYKHFIVSLSPEESNRTSEDVLLSAGKEIGYFFPKYQQVLIALHTNKDHMHLHFIINNINSGNGKRLDITKRMFENLRLHIDRVLEKYALEPLLRYRE